MDKITNAGEERAPLAVRLFWMVLAPIEFVGTVLIGALLYLGGALYFAANVYLKTVSGLFERAVALAVHRFRIGPIFSSAEERDVAPTHSETSVLDPVGRGRFHSWLN